ncbi:unnamed protein product [Amoebophrya sp. A120]|nr:unnamed protein product [Amoebophrya sp. A120]|eukprot:GSA120T00012038001.1
MARAFIQAIPRGSSDAVDQPARMAPQAAGSDQAGKKVLLVDICGPRELLSVDGLYLPQISQVKVHTSAADITKVNIHVPGIQSMKLLGQPQLAPMTVPSAASSPTGGDAMSTTSALDRDLLADGAAGARLRRAAIRPVVSQYVRYPHTGKIMPRVLTTNVAAKVWQAKSKILSGAGIQPVSDQPSKLEYTGLQTQVPEMGSTLQLQQPLDTTTQLEYTGALSTQCPEMGASLQLNMGSYMPQPPNSFVTADVDLVGLSTIGLSNEEKRAFVPMEPVALSSVPDSVLL